MSYNNSSLWIYSISGVLVFLGLYYAGATVQDKMIKGGSSTKKCRHRYKKSKTKKH